MTLHQRVLDAVVAFEAWSDLAIDRLNEIHWPPSSATSVGMAGRQVAPK